MKKKIQISFIALSALFFLWMVIKSSIKIVAAFHHLGDHFSLLPMLWAMIYFVILACHVGLYVAIFDRKEKTHSVTDQEDWWTKWDRV